MLVQGIKYVRPNLLVTHPSAGFNESETGGFLDPLLGTLIVAGIAIAIALPLGVAIAVWLTEYGRPFGLARAVESAIEMIAGTPSIVLALFGTVVFAAPCSASSAARRVVSCSVARSSPRRAVLSLVALPLVVASTREGLRSIPSHLREASYAVGKTKFATVRRILLPSARPSVVTGTMLASDGSSATRRSS